jgi:hypothetical protein
MTTFDLSAQAAATPELEGQAPPLSDSRADGPDWRLVKAYHEGGHAVIHWLVGLGPPEVVSIRAVEAHAAYASLAARRNGQTKCRSPNC